MMVLAMVEIPAVRRSDPAGITRTRTRRHAAPQRAARDHPDKRRLARIPAVRVIRHRGYCPRHHRNADWLRVAHP